MNEPTDASLSRPALWFGMLGGAIAWLIHLLAAALLAEFGCFAGADRHVYFGVTLIAWIIIAASVPLLVLAAAATWTAFRAQRKFDEQDAETLDPHGTARFMAQTGLATSAVFMLIIVAQMVPLLYFLSHC